ncbi:MAG: acyl carrier protein [Acidobacteria bacterium]|jgi:acyl carrier protein|nr:MAG: acyl carrier protein [Acidobacteriota bacterium]
MNTEEDFVHKATATVTDSQERLKHAFAAAFAVSPDSGVEQMVYGECASWDSTAHMVLIAEIESAFDIMLATEDVIDLSSFEKAKEIVAKYGVSFEG